MGIEVDQDPAKCSGPEWIRIRIRNAAGKCRSVLLIMLFFARLTSRECQDKSASTAQSVHSSYQCQVCSLVGQAFLLIYKDLRELDSLSETGNAEDLNLVVSPRVRFLELSNVVGPMRAQQ